MASPFVWVYDDPVRGLVLLRGYLARDLLQAAGVADLARWSMAGRGHVLARAHLPDVLAQADHDGIPVRIKEVTG